MNSFRLQMALCCVAVCCLSACVKVPTTQGQAFLVGTDASQLVIRDPVTGIAVMEAGILNQSEALGKVASETRNLGVGWFLSKVAINESNNAKDVDVTKARESTRQNASNNRVKNVREQEITKRQMIEAEPPVPVPAP
jgi:hypothetical protein